MANQILDDALTAIEEVIRRQSDSVSAIEISRALTVPIPLRTLQYRLKHLVDRNRLLKIGDGRWARYLAVETAREAPADAAALSGREEIAIPLSEAGVSIRDYVRQVPEARMPVGYDHDFLDHYRPNVTFYLTESERMGS